MRISLDERLKIAKLHIYEDVPIDQLARDFNADTGRVKYYKRIRVAYIEAARKRPTEYKKRLESFIKKTRENKIITGYGGTEKYCK